MIEILRCLPLDSPSILRLSAPLVVSFWLRSAFAWIDTIFAAQLEHLEGTPGLGDASIAAIGLALPFEFLTIACWVGASNGLTTRLAAAMGAQEDQKVAQLKKASLRLIGGLSVLFLGVAALIGALAPRVLEDPLLARQFQIYGVILIGGSALTSFWAILPDSIVKAHQDTKGTMWAGLLSSVVNVALNAWFVFGMGWGIAGIAASTVLSRLASLAYAWQRAAGHERRRLADGQPRNDATFVRPLAAILTLALPGAVTYLLLAGEAMVVLALIGALTEGEEQVSLLAAWSIFDRMLRFLVMPGVACSVALLPLAARYSGQGNYAAIRRDWATAERAGWIYSLVFVLPAMGLLGSWVARGLSDTEQTQVLAQQGMPWVALGVAASVPFFLARATLDGVQRPRPGLIASIMRAVFFYVPAIALGLWLAKKMGWSPMHGIAAGACFGTIAGSLLIRNWLGRQLEELAAGAQTPPVEEAPRAN